MLFRRLIKNDQNFPHVYLPHTYGNDLVFVTFQLDNDKLIDISLLLSKLSMNMSSVFKIRNSCIFMASCYKTTNRQSISLVYC